MLSTQDSNLFHFSLFRQLADQSDNMFLFGVDDSVGFTHELQGQLPVIYLCLRQLVTSLILNRCSLIFIQKSRHGMIHDASVIVRERKRVIVTQHSDLSGRNEMETDVEYARFQPVSLQSFPPAGGSE